MEPKSALANVSSSIRRIVDDHLAAITLSDLPEPPPGPVVVAVSLLVNVVGLGAVWRYYQQPIWLALPTLALLCIIPLWLFRSRGTLAVETWAPLYFLYAILAARFVFVRAFQGGVPGYFDYLFPDLTVVFFRIEPWTVCALVYTLAVQLRYLTQGRWPRAAMAGAGSLLVGAFAWAALVYVGQRTHGVTGSDPYAYAQMAVDLVTRGTPLHRFTLFPNIVSLGITWSAVVHTGYHIPMNLAGDAATVWPIGGSLLLALAYRLAGEEGLYLVNPLASLLALAATGWLAVELFAGRASRIWIAAVSIAILSTSHTLFDWATVPMVDAQAALFSAAAFGCALRSRHNESWVAPLLAGVALGAAYFVRHTQVLIAPALFVLIWLGPWPRAVRWRHLVLAAGAALLVAAPDLWYHQLAFGGIFNVESAELNLYSLAGITTTAWSTLVGLTAANEFGWLLPFFLYGAYRLARERLVEFLALGLWLVALVAVHLPYPALRLRDLLPEFVPLAVTTAFGVVVFVEMAWERRGTARRFLAACALLAAMFLLLIRVWILLPQAWSPPQPSFGYVTATQRAAFDQIARLTPADSVVGASLDTGPIDLYAKRETFEPALWNGPDRDRFIGAMLDEKRPVFLLDDSEETSIARHELEGQFAVRQVAVLAVPLFSKVDAVPGALYEIERK